MMGEWQQIQLGKACSKIGSGATPRGGKNAYLGGDTALIRSQNIYNNRFVREGLAYISDAQAHELRNVVVEKNDVLLNITGDSVARCCQVASDVLPARVNQHVAIIRTRPDVLDARFLQYILINPAMQNYLLVLASAGATRNALTKAMIETLDIPAPPLPEQRAIAHILGSLDDKIELNRRQSETLQEMARALFKAWFVDFEPVRAKMSGRWQRGQTLPGLPAHLWDLFPDRLVETEHGEVPEGWEITTAGQIYDIGIGKTPPRKESEWFSESSDDVPWMSIKDLGRAEVFISDVSEYLTREAVEKFRIRRIPDGTVVLSFKLTVGRVAITDGEMLSNEAIAHFLPKTGNCLGTSYLYCYLRNFNYESLGSTSSIATAVNSNSVRAMPITIPSETICKTFESLTVSSFAQIRTILRESHTLAALRDTLLPQLISGKLRVAGAERFLARIGASNCAEMTET